MRLDNCSLSFTGHQTFPVRYGWIYKIIQEVENGGSISSKSEIEAQMASMGMGRNMVLSVRHWVRVFGLVVCTDKKSQSYELTPLARKLFINSDVQNAFDEYMDEIGTVWLLHWLAQAEAEKLSSARYLFNYFNGLNLTKNTLIKNIEQALIYNDKELNETSLKKDIDCFLQMYSARYSRNTKVNEDSFASPFTELGLVVQVDAKHYLAELSLRKTLPKEIFAYALIDFMQKRTRERGETTFSFDALLNDAGSPGRVFRLSAAGLSEKLDEVEQLTQGKLSWTDTQGLRQVQQNYDDFLSIDPALYLAQYYQR